MKKHFFLCALTLMLAWGTCSILTSCGDDPVEKTTPRTNNDDQKGSDDTDGKDNTDDNGDNDDNGGTVVPDTGYQARFVGGDVSMLPMYEQQGAKYMNVSGSPISNVLVFLKQQGWNALRVRLFVNPSASSDKAVCQDLAYVKQLGSRIKQAGLRLMLDFHYSDTWADPSKQWTPAAWASLNDEQLQQRIYDYTKDCLKQMKAAGAEPDFIQTGNEISYGMLWGPATTEANRCYMGQTGGWRRFTLLLSQAGKACREVCPEAKIVLHTERVAQPAVLVNFYQQMAQAGIDYDIIGLSYYPYFHGKLDVLETALAQLEKNFADRPIQIVETGYPNKWEVPGTTIYYTSTYPYSDEGQRKFTADLVALLKKHRQITGLYWWYPEANAFGCNGNLSQDWYNAPLFDNNTGHALPALYELKDFAL